MVLPILLSALVPLASAGLVHASPDDSHRDTPTASAIASADRDAAGDPEETDEEEPADECFGCPREDRYEDERAACTLRPDPARPDFEIEAAVVMVEITTYGARCSHSEKKVEVRTAGSVEFRLEEDDDVLKAECDDSGIVLKRDGATARIVVKQGTTGTMILDPATAARLEKDWVQGTGGNFVALAELLREIPRGASEGPAWILAARASLREGDLAAAERQLARAGSMPLPPEWEARRAQLARRTAAAQERTMPLRFGAPRRLGTLVSIPTTPSSRPEWYGTGEWSPGLFWQGRRLCVEQVGEEPKAMRCYDTERRKWGDKVALRIEGGIPGWLTLGDCAETTCYSLSFLWHSALPHLDLQECPPSVVDDAFVDLAPGPQFVRQGERGLEAVDGEGALRPLPGGIPPEWLRAKNGSTLAGGHLYFAGAVLRDATRPKLTWLPFQPKLTNVEHVLVSPDRAWVAVVTSMPNELWVVPILPGVPASK